MKRTPLSLTLVLLMAGAAMAQPTDDDLPFKETENGEKTPLFMHGESMSGRPSGWKRDAIEAEAVKTLSCVSGDRLYEILRRRNMRSFKRIARNKSMEAFSSGFDVDERPWNTSRHKVREGLGLRGKKIDAASFIWLTIESDRFPSRNNQRRGLRMGTDIMDDMYFDTKYVEGGHPEFMMMDSALTIRGRWRWDALWNPADFFELSDKNDDGALDADELRSLTYMDGDSERTTNADHLIRADEHGDGDGKVTKAELEAYPHVLADMRRILVQIKQDGGVDEEGIKRAGKVDIRNDYGSFADPAQESISGLFDAIVRGESGWSSGPASPLQLAYSLAKVDPATGAERLFDTQTYQQVLVLEPKVFIRSYRSRFHLNETSHSNLVETYDRGTDRLNKILAMAREARAGSSNPEHIEALDAWITKAGLVVEGTAVRDLELTRVTSKAGRAFFGDRVEEAHGVVSLFKGETLIVEIDKDEVESQETTAIDVAANMPKSTSPGRSNSVEDLVTREHLLKSRQIVAEEISRLQHELADELDENRWERVSLRRVIARAIRDRRILDDHVAWFVVWQKSKAPETLGRLTTVDRFVTIHEEIVAGADLATELEAYNAHGVLQRGSGDDDWEDFDPLTERAFVSLGNYLRNEQIRTWSRQIAESGSAAKGLWFDDARQFYIPSSRRNTGNLLIDTMDFAAMYSADVWDGIPIDQRTPATDLNEARFRDKLIDVALVNEVQIELTLSSQFTDRLNEVNGTVALPYHFMRWADSQLPATEQNPDGYKKLYEDMTSKHANDDEGNAKLTADLGPFNEYLAAQGSPVQGLPAHGFRQWIETERFTADLHDEATPDFSPPELAAAIEGANFVYQQYLDMLTYVSDLKGEGTIDEIKDRGGPDCMEWIPSESSKGMKGLSKLREATGGDPTTVTPGDTTGLTGGVSGN